MRLSLPKITILVITGICFWASANLYWGKEHWRKMIANDAKGYYGYLPALFIYDDLDYTFFDTIEIGKYKAAYHDYRNEIDGEVVNKYFCGTAVLELPFFAIGHAVTLSQGAAPDGYSRYYAIWIGIGAVFYLFLGLWWFDNWLREWAIPPWIRALMAVAITFGTHLFYYGVATPGLSHVYSFAFVSLFLWQGSAFFAKAKGKHLILALTALGMIVLIRPVNGLVVLALPFLAGSWQGLIAGIQSAFRGWPALVTGLLLMGAVIGLQLLMYQLQTGHWWVYAYTHETLQFQEFQLDNFLFSYKKGFFLYTPLALISLAGLVGVFVRNRFQAISGLLAIAVICYVLSAWWLWWYGGGYSMRVLVEFLPLFLVFLALGLNDLKGWRKTSLIALVVLLIGITQLQTFQYRHGLIHWEDMDAEWYWRVFLEIPG